MYAVTYHQKTVGSYFIGIAESYQDAESIVREDMKNANETDTKLYHIEPVSMGYACAFGIAGAVAREPYIAR